MLQRTDSRKSPSDPHTRSTIEPLEERRLFAHIVGVGINSAANVDGVNTLNDGRGASI